MEKLLQKYNCMDESPIKAEFGKQVQPLVPLNFRERLCFLVESPHLSPVVLIIP